MEILFACLFFGVIIYIAVGISGRTAKRYERPTQSPDPQKAQVAPKTRTVERNRTPQQPHKAPARPSSDMPEIEGYARIIDGDSLKISRTEIRLYGVDAPELNHPWGQKAKWALVALCKGHRVRARIVEWDTHGRTVAMCYLPDGRDVSEEMVRQGLALDWPKFSGGDYRHVEPEGVRKKLWLADARQKGRMHVWAQFEARRKDKAAQAK